MDLQDAVLIDGTLAGCSGSIGHTPGHTLCNCLGIAAQMIAELLYLTLL